MNKQEPTIVVLEPKKKPKKKKNSSQPGSPAVVLDDQPGMQEPGSARSSPRGGGIGRPRTSSTGTRSKSVGLPGPGNKLGSSGNIRLDDSGKVEFGGGGSLRSHSSSGRRKKESNGPGGNRSKSSPRGQSNSARTSSRSTRPKVIVNGAKKPSQQAISPKSPKGSSSFVVIKSQSQPSLSTSSNSPRSVKSQGERSSPPTVLVSPSSKSTVSSSRDGDESDSTLKDLEVVKLIPFRNTDLDDPFHPPTNVEVIAQLPADPAHSHISHRSDKSSSHRSVAAAGSVDRDTAPSVRSYTSHSHRSHKSDGQASSSSSLSPSSVPPVDDRGVKEHEDTLKLKAAQVNSFPIEEFENVLSVRAVQLLCKYLDPPRDNYSAGDLQHMGSIFPLLERQYRKRPQKSAVCFMDDKYMVKESLSYKDIQYKANCVAAVLRTRVGLHKGDRVLMCYPPGVDYVPAFLGCLRASVIPVVVSAPRSHKDARDVERLAFIAENCSPSLLLTTHDYQKSMKLAVLMNKWPTKVDWLSTDDLKVENHELSGFARSLPQSNDVAFIQYTSGSTGDCKGVIISHGNLLHNVVIGSFMGPGLDGHDSIYVSWLPHYSSASIVSVLLGSLCVGGSLFLMSPYAFMKEPSMWIKTMSAVKATATVAPSFAYNLVADKWTDPMAKTDLSSLRSCIVGGEYVQADFLRHFSSVFEDAGLREGVFKPMYGLTECTSTVCSYGNHPYISEMLSPVRDDKVPRVSNGSPLYGLGFDIRIVNPSTKEECHLGEVGEVWIRGPSVAVGYWNRPKTTERVFQAKIKGENPNLSFLRTGDYGSLVPHSREYMTGETAHQMDMHEIDEEEDIVPILHEEKSAEAADSFPEVVKLPMGPYHLLILGRMKDMIMIKGEQVYPDDIEHHLIEVSKLLHKGCTAVFSLEFQRDHSDEDVVIVSEINQNELEIELAHKPNESIQSILNTLGHAIKRHFIELVDVAPSVIVFVKEGAVSKTRTGMLQRRLTKQRFIQGSFDSLYEWDETKPADSIDILQSLQVGGAPAIENTTAREDLSILLMSYGVVDFHSTLVENGLDSMRVVELMMELNEKFDLGLRYLDMMTLPARKLVASNPNDNQSQTPQTPGGDRRTFGHKGTMARRRTMATDEMQGEPWEPWMRHIGQVGGIFMILLLFALSLFPSVSLVHFTNDLGAPWSSIRFYGEGGSHMFGLLTLFAVPLFFISYSLIVILTKKLVIGRYTPGRHVLYSSHFMRWWFVDRLVATWEFTVGRFLLDTFFLTAFYRAMGAEIEYSCRVNEFFRDFDLFEFGGHVHIDGHLYARSIEASFMWFDTISVGHSVRLKKGSVVQPGVIIAPSSLIDFGTVVESGSNLHPPIPTDTYLSREVRWRWFGNPATFSTIPYNASLPRDKNHSFGGGDNPGAPPLLNRVGTHSVTDVCVTDNDEKSDAPPLPDWLEYDGISHTQSQRSQNRMLSRDHFDSASSYNGDPRGPPTRVNSAQDMKQTDGFFRFDSFLPGDVVRSVKAIPMGREEKMQQVGRILILTVMINLINLSMAPISILWDYYPIPSFRYRPVLYLSSLYLSTFFVLAFLSIVCKKLLVGSARPGLYQDTWLKDLGRYTMSLFGRTTWLFSVFFIQTRFILAYMMACGTDVHRYLTTFIEQPMVSLASADLITLGSGVYLHDTHVECDSDFSERECRIGNRSQTEHNAIRMQSSTINRWRSMEGVAIHEWSLVGDRVYMGGGVYVGKHSVVANGTVLPEDTRLDPGSTAIGIPHRERQGRRTALLGVDVPNTLSLMLKDFLLYLSAIITTFCFIACFIPLFELSLLFSGLSIFFHVLLLPLYIIVLQFTILFVAVLLKWLVKQQDSGRDIKGRLPISWSFLPIATIKRVHYIAAHSALFLFQGTVIANFYHWCNGLDCSSTALFLSGDVYEHDMLSVKDEAVVDEGAILSGLACHRDSSILRMSWVYNRCVVEPQAIVTAGVLMEHGVHLGAGSTTYPRQAMEVMEVWRGNPALFVEKRAAIDRQMSIRTLRSLHSLENVMAHNQDLEQPGRRVSDSHEDLLYSYRR